MQLSDNPIFALAAEYTFINDSHIEKRIAQITLENIADFKSMTVERISELCQVSVSTYLRFCRKIGYASFTEFKVRMIDALSKYTYLNTPFSRGENYTSQNFFEQYKRIINDDYEMLEDLLDRAACVRAAKEFEKSRRIFIVDLFYSTVRFALHSDLAVTGKSVSMIHPGGCMEAMRQEGIDKNCLVFFVYDGSTRTYDVCPALKACKKMGCKIIVMSCEEHFYNEELCDEILVIGKASSAVSSIMLHDLTFQYLSAIYRELAML